MKIEIPVLAKDKICGCCGNKATRYYIEKYRNKIDKTAYGVVRSRCDGCQFLAIDDRVVISEMN